MIICPIADSKILTHLLRTVDGGLRVEGITWELMSVRCRGLGRDPNCEATLVTKAVRAASVFY